MKRRLSRFPLLFFALFWCAIVGVFDVVLARQTLQQLDASRRFLPVPATVLKSSIDASSDSDGTTYRPVVSFEYTVAGTTHQADTVHFGVWGSSDRSAAEEIVDRFPEGSQTTAYYDPSDHSQAVLLTDLKHLPTFVVLFLTPFHCVGVGVFVLALRGDKGPYADPALNRAIRSDDGTVAILRSSRPPVWLVFLGTLGGGAFISVFVIAIGFGMHAPMSVSFGTLGGLVAVAAIVSAVVSRRRQPELNINRASRTISRPGQLRADRYGVPENPTRFADIRAITVERTSWGEVNDVPHYRHTLLADRTNQPEPLELVRVSGPAGFADPLAAWFREQIGLPEPMPGPASGEGSELT